MAKRTERNLIVGLDIGTSKVAAIVGELTAEGHLEVIIWRVKSFRTMQRKN